MEMKTVHYYIAVAEELNLTRAAERLMMSQPPLSYQMKKLEEELGVTLFLRGKRRLELTDAGKLFLRRAYELEALEEKSREEMQSFGKGISNEPRGVVTVLGLYSSFLDTSYAINSPIRSTLWRNRRRFFW